jgi:hypothetical protein
LQQQDSKCHRFRRFEFRITRRIKLGEAAQAVVLCNLHDVSIVLLIRVCVPASPSLISTPSQLSTTEQASKLNLGRGDGRWVLCLHPGWIPWGMGPFESLDHHGHLTATTTDTGATIVTRLPRTEPRASNVIQWMTCITIHPGAPDPELLSHEASQATTGQSTF